MVPTPTSAGSPVSGTGEQVSSGQTDVQNYLQPLLERIQCVATTPGHLASGAIKQALMVGPDSDP